MSLVAGLTGGIASGKSTAARSFQDLGAFLVDADLISRDLVVPGSPLLKEIVEAFGRGILLESGELNRPRLATLIFTDADKRRFLEDILHPAIAEETAHRVNDLRENHKNGIIIVDAALMIETERHRKYEKLIVVYVDEETQFRRLMARDGLSRDEAKKRIASQMPLSEKKKLADFVIDNNGPPERTVEAVRQVYEKLKRAESGGL